MPHNPTGLGMSRAAVEGRRQRYAELREQGASEWDAAQALGVDERTTGGRYERWYQARKAGTVVEAAR